MKKRKDKTIKRIKEKGAIPLVIFLVLRFLVMLCMVLQIIRGDLNNALLCLLSLILFTLPSLIERKLNIELPSVLEIIIYLFIFSAEILGEINNFYGIIPMWDTMLHTINGFICAGVGFSLIDLLNQKSKSIELSKIYLCLVAFCFSMTIETLWEFFEYGVDKKILLDMQKDTTISTISTVSLDETNTNKAIVVKNIDKTILYDKNGNELAIINGGYLDIGLNDTMKDLIVNFIGATVFCIIGYIYLIEREKNTDKRKFIDNFIVKRKKVRE